jgi:hypothetical protein
MKNYLKKGGLLGFLLLGLMFFSQQALAATYSGNIFINSDALSTATIIGVFSSSPTQGATAGNLMASIVYSDNVTYLGNPYAKQIDISLSPYQTVYVLLKKGTTDYGITQATLGKESATNTTITAITYYKMGVPTPPDIGAIQVKYESANAAISNYSADYLYSSVNIRITGEGAVAGTKLNYTDSVTSKPTSYKVAELINNCTLESGKTYHFWIAGVVNGVGEGAYNTKAFTMLSGGGVQTYLLTLESQAPGGPGLNLVSLPFAGPWYAFDKTGATPLFAGAPIAKAYDLVKAVNEAAGGKYVSTFGQWNRTSQNDTGVLITGNDIENGLNKTALQAIDLRQGRGYQLYIGTLNAAGVTGVTGGKVELLIKNTP